MLTDENAFLKKEIDSLKSVNLLLSTTLPETIQNNVTMALKKYFKKSCLDTIPISKKIPHHSLTDSFSDQVCSLNVNKDCTAPPKPKPFIATNISHMPLKLRGKSLINNQLTNSSLVNACSSPSLPVVNIMNQGNISGCAAPTISYEDSESYLNYLLLAGVNNYNFDQAMSSVPAIIHEQVEAAMQYHNLESIVPEPSDILVTQHRDQISCSATSLASTKNLAAPCQLSCLTPINNLLSSTAQSTSTSLSSSGIIPMSCIETCYQEISQNQTLSATNITNDEIVLTPMQKFAFEQCQVWIKAICVIMDAIVTKDEMIHCSATSKKTAKDRPILAPAKLEFIIKSVQKKFNTINRTQIIQKISNKFNDFRNYSKKV